MTRLIDIPRCAPALVLAGLTLALAACATGPRDTIGPRTAASAPPAGIKVGKPYQIKGRWYTPRHQPDYDETGVGSWYGEQFHNRHTANGEVFDMDLVSAAHTTLPLPSLVEVTNLDNGRRLVVRVNDRGPFVDGRVIDLSREAARQLGYERQGVARVRVRYLGPAPANASEARTWQASAPPAPRPAPQAPPAARIATAAPAMQILSPPQPSVEGPEYLPNIRPPRLEAGPPLPAPASPYRIQAGAFADRGRAEQAVSALSIAGRAEIVPIDRGGATLYRVQVVGEGEAYAVRDRVAALGYVDARILPLD